MIQLINGNMLVELSKIDNNSIDLVIADLPYGQTKCSWDNKIDLIALWIELKRVAKPNPAFLFFCTTKFGYELIKSNEKWFRYDLVWNKENVVGFLNAKKMPMRLHEMIYVFYDKLPVYNISYNHIHKPTKPTTYDTGEVYKTTIKQSSTGRQYEPKLPTSIIQINSLITSKSIIKKHPTEKPISLYEYLIKYYTNKDGKVLDVCFGSCNSGKACKNLNRDYIGIELDEIYYNSATQILVDF